MKRIAAILLLALPVLAHAQLKVLSVQDAPKEICHVTESSIAGIDSRIFVYFSDGNYYISAHTTNRFDEVFTFFLGKTQENAVATLNDLAGLCSGNPVGTRIALERWPGEPCLCVIASSFHTTEKAPNGSDLKPTRLLLGADKFAGVVDVSRKNILSLADKVEKYKL